MNRPPTALVALVLALVAACRPAPGPGGSGEDAGKVHDGAVGEVGAADLVDAGMQDADTAELADSAVDGDALADSDAPADAIDGDQGTGDDIDAAVLFDTVDALDLVDDAGAEVSIDAQVPPDVPQSWTVLDGCAVPQAPPLSPECAAAACAAGEICVGNGYCVPDGPMDLPGGLTHTLVEGIATRADGSWALTTRTGGPAQWDVKLVAFNTPAPIPSFILDVPHAPGTWNSASAVQPLANGGWLVVGMQYTVTTWDLVYWSWPVDSAGNLDPQGPYAANQNKLNQNGKTPDGGTPTGLIALRDGNYLMAWYGAFGGPTSDPISVRVRYLSPKGIPMGQEVVVAPPVWPAMGYAPGVAPLDDGAAFVVWHANQKKGTKSRIRGTILPPLATGTGTAFDLSPSAFALETVPSITTWQDGAALVGWKAGTNPAGGCAIRTKLQFLQGPPPAPQGQLSEVDFDAEGTYRFASALAVLDNKRAVAVWHNMDSKMQSIYLTRYYRGDDVVDCEKTDVAGPLLANEQAVRTEPVVASLSHGSFVVAWSTDFLAGPDQSPNYVVRLRYFAY